MEQKTMNYCINQHTHLYAAWAASRGASVMGCRFRVEQGRELLESCGFTPSVSRPKQLPNLKSIDESHKTWRQQMIKAARQHNLKMTHGVAAKLINLYLKCRFVCGGYHDHPRVRNLHPPIDSVMLKALAKANVGGFETDWKKLQDQKWSKLNSTQYEKAIQLIRHCMDDEPLWKIEEYWQGNQ